MLQSRRLPQSAWICSGLEGSTSIAIEQLDMRAESLNKGQDVIIGDTFAAESRLRLKARMAKLADAADLKSADLYRSWGFKSPSGHHKISSYFDS